jgi:hypothetical protein
MLCFRSRSSVSARGGIASLLFIVFCLTVVGVSAQTPKTPPASVQPFSPPETWQEHWFEHNQLLHRVAYNDEVALYFDKDMPSSAAEWMLPFLTKLWHYTKETYGSFGPDGGLYAVFHQGRYSGGHPSTYLDASHDYRNVIDCGPGPWDGTRTGIIDIPSHEVGHIVEGASRDIRESPAFDLWGDSKWAEFYQYDAYVALGRDADASRLFERFSRNTDSFPRAGTHWFRDWFYPLWHDYGHAKVMVNFFRLLSQNFPTELQDDGKIKAYSRRMNWGEYIHFMSGAAGTDLKPLATKAFGWPPEWETQYQKARTEFPKIKY